MHSHLPNSNRRWSCSALLLVLGLVLLWHPAYAKKNKTDNNPTSPQLKQRIAFDIRKIVWPNPPAIARIKFLELYTGEKIDWTAFEQNKKKPKQKWMDRLAGTKPPEDVDMSKVPFQLVRTNGVAVDSKGNIYAADQAVGAIFIFNPETKDVQMVRNGKEGRFGLINGIAIDDNDRLFVTDDKFREVLVFNAKHQEETAFGADILGNPGGVAIDTENRFLYVVDTANDVVDVFDADSLKLLRKIGVPGKKHQLTDPGTFSLPTNVAVDADGNVYVSDTLNARVEIFDAEGNFISQFGKRGDGAWQLERPKGIAVDCDGHIWIVDAAQDRVKVFNREGRLLIYFGTHGSYPGEFSAIYGIAIDKFDRVITSEQYPGRVQVFRYVTDAEAEQARQEQAASPVVPAAPRSNESAQMQNSAAH